MTEAATNSTDKTASRTLYECHLDLLAFNEPAISTVELATNCSIGTLSMTVAFLSELVGSCVSVSPVWCTGRPGSDELLPFE